MASYFRTMTRMAYLYPTLYPTEENCLHHLFFVNGNGYDWVGGELVTIEDIPPDGTDRRPEELEFTATVRGLRESAHFALGMAKEYPDRMERFNKLTRLAKLEGFLGLGLFLNIEDACRWARPHMESLYPICQYADIVNIPNDVKPDWLEAALRAYNWATGLSNVGEENKRWLQYIGERVGELIIRQQEQENANAPTL